MAGMDEPLAGLPAGAETPQEAGDQQAESGLSSRQKRMASLLTRLAATSRSFLLYDPHNEAIQRFITILLEQFTSALADEGPLSFQVQPLEILFEDGLVYLNRDRERSLAFRLYRDGVRSLRFRPGFDWEELAKLLEVLSIRYTGVNQREEDVVTLLWKARFRHLEVVAVEGILPEDDELPAGGSGGAREAQPLSLPDDVDLPRPFLPTPVGPSWVKVTPEALERLRGEASGAFVPEDCLALLARLRAQIGDKDARMAFADVAHLFIEVRDFLLSEDHVEPLRRYISFLWSMASEEPPAWDTGRHQALYELLETCGDRRAVRRLLRSVPSDARKLNRALIDVLDRACPDPLSAVAEALEEETGLAVRAVARQLLEHYGARKLDVLNERFKSSAGQTASDLLRVIANIGGDEAAAIIARQASHPDRAVQDEALWHLENMPYSGAVGRAFFDAFRWTDPARRARVLGMIARTGDKRFLELLAGFVDEQGASLSAGEAAQIGQVLGELGGDASAARWAEWLTPAGLFRKALPGSAPRQIAAALALSELRADRAAEILESALDAAEPEVQQWILGAIAQRERNRSGA
jgi:DNA-binding transcriptional ArsR family regulator